MASVPEIKIGNTKTLYLLKTSVMITSKQGRQKHSKMPKK